MLTLLNHTSIMLKHVSMMLASEVAMESTTNIFFIYPQNVVLSE